MGTWGTGYFEDDFALDFIDDVEESNDPKQIIKNVLKNAVESNYLESDDATAVIISCTYIDSQLNGTKFSRDEEDHIEVDTFSSRNPSIDFSDLKINAITALKKVITDNSELNELWFENEEDYPIWKNGVEKLIQSLSK